MHGGCRSFDGAASVLIGLLLTVAAVFLARESKGLLIGESADPEIVTSIREAAESDPDVEGVSPPLTMHLSPRDVLLNLDVRFRHGLSKDQIADAVERMERRIQREHPEVRRICIKAEKPEDRTEQDGRGP